MSSTNKDAGASPATPTRRAKKLLAPSVKYEIFLQLVRGETTINAAAEAAGVDRSTIMKLRQVAKETSARPRLSYAELLGRLHRSGVESFVDEVRRHRFDLLPWESRTSPAK